MNRRLLLVLVFFSIGIVSLLSSVWAHDLWLVPQPRRLPTGEDIRLLAQTGMKFPESSSAVSPDRLHGAWIVDASGRRELQGGMVDGKSLVFKVRFDKPGVALAAIAVKPKFIHIKAEEFNEYLEHDGLPQILELREEKGELGVDGREMYAKCAKAILRIGEGGTPELATRPAGLRIEIVPLKDPYQLSGAGGKLPVQVLFEGQPLQGVYVYPLAEGEDKYLEGFETDAEGKTIVPINRHGLWSLHCIYMRSYSDKSKADWESFFATVSFLVREP